jgi:DNA-binding CsgD family transcriptional regulator
MAPPIDQQLIDRIYECAFEAKNWPSIFDELARIADARGGYLLTAKTGSQSWTASESIRGNIERTVSEHWLERGGRFRRAAAARHSGFLTDYDIYTDAEMAVDPFYRDLLWPAGFGWGAGNTIPLPTGDTLVFGVERTRERGPVEASIVQQLDLLHPHIARSALLSARLQLESAYVASKTLELIGLPALVFSESAKVLAANRLIEDLTGQIRWRAHDHISLMDPSANAIFHQAVQAFNSADVTLARSLVLCGEYAAAAMVAHVIPIRRSARDVFVRCAGMLVITPVAAPPAPAVELIQSLFDLSPAEARVARNLAAGQTVDEIAALGGISGNTVRTQVRRVLEKTGCRRQTEVVALLSGIAVRRG